MQDMLEPPGSHELYMNLAIFARVYEELMRKKQGDAYSAEFLYQGLREHMPGFLLRLIGMDSVISMLLTMNAKPRKVPEDTVILQPGTVLDSRLMEIRENGSFNFHPKFVEMIHEHARKNDLREDSMDRTEDRGCPVLYSSERDAIIRLSIEELIAQHQSY